MSKFRRISPPVTAERNTQGSWDVVDAAGGISNLSDSLFRRLYRPVDDDAYKALGIEKQAAPDGNFGRVSAASL